MFGCKYQIEEVTCDIEEILNKGKLQYGDNFHDHLLKEYELYVSSMQHATDKRIQVTTWYVTILSLLTSLIIVNIAQKEMILPLTNKTFLILPMIGFLLCILWFLSIRSCADLMFAKLVIILTLTVSTNWP